jgi:hypothetical protein
MKKIQFAILGLLVLLIYSCDPNKQIYEELDAMRVPYNEAFEYTLVDADFTTMKTLALKEATNLEDSTLANQLGSLKSFSPTRDVAYFVPMFLESTFKALDSASAIKVLYKFDYKFIFTNEQKIPLTDTFTSLSYLPTIISDSITEPETDDFVYISYKFDDGTTVTSAASLYQFNGTAWTIPSDALVLTDADYDAMGTGSGQPGQNNNFSSSVSSDYFLPIFLEQKYPYAAANQTVQLSYKYYASGVTDIYYVKCFFDGTKWYLYETKSNQFLHNGIQWVFDPTVKYNMIKSDFQIIVDWVLANDTLAVYQNGTYTNSEWWFGSSAYYGNFDLRDYKHQANDHFELLTGLDAEGIKNVVLARIPTAIDILLLEIFPEAVPFSNGVPVYYEIYFKIYTGKYATYMIKYLCTDVGTFEFVSGPEFIY